MNANPLQMQRVQWRWLVVKEPPAYIVDNPTQLTILLERLEENGYVWNSGSLPTASFTKELSLPVLICVDKLGRLSYNEKNPFQPPADNSLFTPSDWGRYLGLVINLSRPTVPIRKENV